MNRWSIGWIPDLTENFHFPTSVSEIRFRDTVHDLCTPHLGAGLPRSRRSTVFPEQEDVERRV